MPEPFLKWPGGKRQLLPELKSRMPQNYNRYFEPFIGAGALLFSVLPKEACINDTNLSLINAYRQIKENPEKVISCLETLPNMGCTSQTYLQLRDRYNEMLTGNEMTPYTAALLIWLNKHCFNGLYRVNSKGLFNSPFNGNQNFNTKPICENIILASEYLNAGNIVITNTDFEIACENAAAGDFVYFDPPYYPVSATANFTSYTGNGFDVEDQIRLSVLAKELAGKGVYVMVSNSDVPEIHELYRDFCIEIVTTKRLINRVATKRTGTEVIVTTY